MRIDLPRVITASTTPFWLGAAVVGLLALAVAYLLRRLRPRPAATA